MGEKTEQGKERGWVGGGETENSASFQSLLLLLGAFAHCFCLLVVAAIV